MSRCIYKSCLLYRRHCGGNHTGIRFESESKNIKYLLYFCTSTIINSQTRKMQLDELLKMYNIIYIY